MSKNILITQGGCGTTSLIPILQSYIADDVHRHERIPELLENKHPTSKVVYIFGNPYDTLVSCSGRKFGEDSFLYYHASNLIWDEILPDKKNKHKQLLESDGHPRGTAEEILESYLDVEQDCFDFENHYSRWKHKKDRTYSIRFVRYEGLLQHGISLFNEWWDVNIPENVWSPRQRNADYTNLNKDVFSKLESMYGDWFEKYQSLPLVEDVYPEELTV